MKRHRHVSINGMRAINDSAQKPTVIRVGHGGGRPLLLLELRGDGKFELALETDDRYGVHSVPIVFGRMHEDHVELLGIPAPLVGVTGPDGEQYGTPDILPQTLEVRGVRAIEPPDRDAGETGRMKITDPSF